MLTYHTIVTNYIWMFIWLPQQINLQCPTIDLMRNKVSGAKVNIDQVERGIKGQRWEWGVSGVGGNCEQSRKIYGRSAPPSVIPWLNVPTAMGVWKTPNATTHRMLGTRCVVFVRITREDHTFCGGQHKWLPALLAAICVICVLA